MLTQFVDIMVGLLNRRVGPLGVSLLDQVEKLSIGQLEQLGDALLDIATADDLKNWLHRVTLG